MLMPPNLPHWAFESIETEHGRQWPVWSREMWRMVIGGAMELWQMCYALRCSPEGLQMTAKRRGEDWPAPIDLAEQERKLRFVLDEQEREQAARAALEP
jgi:hypothetical protein